MKNLLEREPLAVRGAVVAAVTAVLHVLVLLGVLPIDPEQEDAIAGAIDLLGTAVLVVWTRGKVTPVAKAQPEPEPEAEPDEPTLEDEVL